MQTHIDQVSKDHINRPERVSFNPPPTTYNRGRVFVNSKIRGNNDNNVYSYARSDDISQQQYTNWRQNDFNYTTNDNDMNYNNVTGIHQTTVRGDNYNNLRNDGIDVSRNAISYASRQTLPRICIHCTPKIDDQQKAEKIIKALFVFIEQDFRKLNTDYNLPLDFEHWCIDKNGDLLCYTRNLDLYIYLCEPQNYPLTLITTNIAVSRPKHLPWQRSVTLKFVPNYITLEEIRKKLSFYFKSIFNLEEIYRTQTDTYRNLRLEMTSKTEYDELVYDGEVMINSHLIEIQAFYAPLRLLMCSKCNEPGHFKWNCYSDYEVCQRCGENKGIGNHQDCIVRCHRCGQDHLSTNYRCPFLAQYRRALRFRLRQQSDFLQQNFHIFIPTEYHQRNNQNSFINSVSMNNNTSRDNQIQQLPFNINDHVWPPLVRRQLNYYIKQTTKQSIWKKQKSRLNKTTQLKEELDIKTDNCHPSKYEDDIQHLPSVLPAVSEETKYRNESSEPYYTTLNEVIPILSSTVNAVQELTVKYAASNTTNKDDIETQGLIQRISKSLECIKAWNSLHITDETPTNNLVEQDGHLMVQEPNNVIENVE